MLRKIITLLTIIPVIIALAACSSLSLPGAQSSSSQAQGTPGAPSAPNAQFPAQTVEDKLAAGTLKLEGTDKAITAEQAKALLPLWKGMKSLAASSTASTQELNSLYKQIEEAMSAEQVQAIKDMNLTPNDFQALMKLYNITMPQRPQGTPGAQASGKSSSGGATGSGATSGGTSATGSGGAGVTGGPGGGPGDVGGGMPPDMAGGTGTQSGSGQANAQRTPGARPAGARPGGGMSNVFVDPLISLLQTRSGASGS